VPIPDLELYVLDPIATLFPLRSGGTVVGGQGLARGVPESGDLTRSDLSAIASVMAKRDGCTGPGILSDVVAMGTCEYLAESTIRQDTRLSDRVGEIETVLAQHIGVRGAVVVASEDHVGDKQLVGLRCPQRICSGG